MKITIKIDTFLRISFLPFSKQKTTKKRYTIASLRGLRSNIAYIYMLKSKAFVAFKSLLIYHIYE